jgi:AraC family transcriptional regulator
LSGYRRKLICFLKFSDLLILLVKVNWKNGKNQSPILFARKAAWTGFHINHWLVSPGDMPEQSSALHEINVALKGSLTTEKQTASGNRQRTLGGVGSICLTPAGQPIAASWDDELECVAVNFEPSFVTQTALANHLSPGFELVEIYRKTDPLIQHIALNLLDELNSEQPTGRIYAESLVQTLVLHLLRNYSTARFATENSTGGLSGYRLRRVTEFIHEHLEQDLGLAEIADVAGLSQFHFARAFRRSTGLTPQQYIMQKRIEHAKLLLADRDLPLVEVSARVGFKNQSHFTTLFRKFTRLTPKAWRELKHA